MLFELSTSFGSNAGGNTGYLAVHTFAVFPATLHWRRPDSRTSPSLRSSKVWRYVANRNSDGCRDFCIRMTAARVPHEMQNDRPPMAEIRMHLSQIGFE